MYDVNHMADLFGKPQRDPLWWTSRVGSSHVGSSKVVRKEWGKEYWLVDESAPWGFKVLYLRAGKRTSLQYHEQKEEACLVLMGEGLIHYAESSGHRTRVDRIVAGDVVHIKPGGVHRFEGVTDTILVEVSNPQLDDVIRLEDDWSRANGRIDAEHSEEEGLIERQ